jgi:AraC-like DNA-binding protein
MRRINEGLLAAAGTPWAMGPRLAAEVTQLLALKERFEADPRQPLVAAALRTCVCTVIHETASGHGGAPADAAAALVAAARAYLLAHLDERVRIPDLVRHLGFSRSHLFTIFRSATGMTPNDYLLRLRLGEAQRLLARQRDSITVIALRTGFSSSQYFSSVFRKYTGQTPQDFRATCRV